MCSSSPEKSPKSQLAIEQPLISGYWNAQKMMPHGQGQRKSLNEMVGGSQ